MRGSLTRRLFEVAASLYQRAAPNTYEAPGCQETDYSSERFFCFFSAFQGLASSTVGLIG
jgi:hypothetical protein